MSAEIALSAEEARQQDAARPPWLRALRGSENLLVVAALALAVVLPCLEIILRKFFKSGLPATAVIVQHLVLAIGMLGGAAEGFAEDYAYLIQGLLDLYEATFDLGWLQWAERLQVTMDERFWDEARGGYFNSAAGDPSIVLRLKEDYDGAEPAPSSVAAMNLLRLAAMLNHDALAQRGRRAVEAFHAQWSGTPQALPAMLCALALALEPSRQVVLVGDPAREDFQALGAVLHERLGPRRSVLAITGESDRVWWTQRAPWVADMKAIDGKSTAYLCEHFTCQAPVTQPEELRRLL